MSLHGAQGDPQYMLSDKRRRSRAYMLMPFGLVVSLNRWMVTLTLVCQHSVLETCVVVFIPFPNRKSGPVDCHTSSHLALISLLGSVDGSDMHETQCIDALI